jgi:hypothetical protein
MQRHPKHQNAKFLGSDDVMGDLEAAGRQVIFLYDIGGEDDQRWLEQLDRISQLKHLGETSKIALAVLLCKEKALEKARTIPRVNTTSKLFLEKLMQELAPENMIRRDQVYQEVVSEARGDDVSAADWITINSAASYDHMQSTVMLRLPGGTGLKQTLADTGARIDLIREDQVPNGSVTKQLKRPLHIILTEKEVRARYGEEPELKVRFVPESGKSD